MSFANDVSKFAKKSTARISRLKKGVAIELFRSVIMDTPVGNPKLWNITEEEAKRITASGYVGGRLRGGWRASFGTADKGEGGIDEGGSATVLAMSTKISTAPDEPDFILINRLPYAYRIEYDGWSKRAPEGMVRKNTKRIKNLINKTLKDVKATIK